MKTFKTTLGLFILLLISHPSQGAEVCGRVSTSTEQTVILADLQTGAEPIYMSVTNPEIYQWQKGSCVCAIGNLSCRKGQVNCKLSISEVTAEDPSGQDCLPTWFP